MAMEASDDFPIEIPMGNLKLSEGNRSMVLAQCQVCRFVSRSDMWSAPKSIETQ